jgi:PAS domain S-box-containing protein
LLHISDYLAERPMTQKALNKKKRETGGRRARTRPLARNSSARQAGTQVQAPPPELQQIYDTAPVGLAFLSPDCRYIQINQRLTEICGISVAEHLGRTVRETVPQVAADVEKIVESIMRTGEAVMGVEVRGQQPDKANADRVWITNWHPFKRSDGSIVGVNVVAEEVTERRRAEAVLTASETALRESEIRFHELADNISQFVWTADPLGARNWYNKRWLDYTGTTLEEAQGWGWMKSHHPEHIERVLKHLRECLRNGTPWQDTFPLRGRDGSYRWFLSRAQPIRNEAGEVIRWFGTNTDVTEQIEAENALRELNETLEQRVEKAIQERIQIWNVCMDLLVICDSEGKFLEANPAWTTLLGWTEAELLGKTSEWLIRPDEREKARVETQSLASGLRTRRFELHMRAKDGSYRLFSWEAVPHRGRIYAMARDETEQVAAEENLRLARRELAQAARRSNLAVVSAAIAHEIKQPLGAIVANANAGMRWLARSPPNADKVLDSFKAIAADGLRASEVIQSIRAIFKQSDQTITALDVNNLVQETIALVSGDLAAAKIAVHLDLASKLSLVSAHRGQLQQVILNLVTNAADAMRTIDGRSRVLKVKSEAVETDRIAVSVEDSGVGIDPDNMERIFDAFFTTKSNGMGMGLAICQSVIENHGGTLSASLAVPHGSVFRLVLPRQ